MRKSDVMTGVMVLVGVSTSMVALAVLNGLVLSVMWGWFAVPLFGLPPIGVAGAIGLTLTCRLLSVSPSEKKGDDETAAAFIAPSRCWASGG